MSLLQLVENESRWIVHGWNVKRVGDITYVFVNFRRIGFGVIYETDTELWLVQYFVEVISP